jgi:transposase-like protein
MSDMARRERRRYTAEQRADAVRLAREVGNVSKVARDPGIHKSTLHQ